MGARAGLTGFVSGRIVRLLRAAGLLSRDRRGRWRLAAYLAAGLLVAALGAVGLVRLAAGPGAPDPTALPAPAPLFTTYGVSYTRVGIAYLDTSRQRSVSVSVPAAQAPVAVFAACQLADPHSRSQSDIALTTTPGYTSYGGQFGCANAATHTSQLPRSALPAGGTRLTFEVMDSYADAPADAAAAWAFAIYTVAVPAEVPAQPPSARSITLTATPALLPGTYTLVHSYSGFWPAQRTVRVTIPAGQPSIVAFQCADPLAGTRIMLPGTEDSTFVNGGDVTCAAPVRLTAAAVAQLGEERPPSDTTNDPATFTLTLDPVDQSRTGAWTVAVYQR